MKRVPKAQRKIYETILKKDGKTQQEIEIIISQLESLTYKEYCGTGLKKYQILYGEENGLKKWKDKNANTFKHTLPNLIDKYGEKEGTLKWENYCKKRAESYKQRKIKGIKHNNGRDLESYIRLYGKEGERLWLERNKKQSYRFSANYYKNNFENWEEEYKKYIISMNKVSLKSFIGRYGKEKGTEKYKINCDNISKNGMRTTLVGFKKKYGEEEGVLHYYNWLKNSAAGLKNFLKKGYSKISQELFWQLYENLDNKENVHFAELNKEWWFILNKPNYKFCYVDFKKGNKLIEFQGTYWHSFENVKIKDKIKKEELEKVGYKLLSITEEEYNKNKISTILKCLKFINYE